MNIALKEANETEYWLRLLHETDYLSKEQYKSLHTDIHELISLLMAICRTANNKNNSALCILHFALQEV